ncbi:MAG: hypothetical protein AAF721_40760 [Myxococcota bacterium]
MDKPRSEPTHFINVDLDLQSGEALDPLIAHWGDRVFALRHDGSDENGWDGGFELGAQTSDAESTILGFVQLVEELPAELRERWDSLGKRNVDVGIQAGSHPRSWSFGLAPETLAGRPTRRVRTCRLS